MALPLQRINFPNVDHGKESTGKRDWGLNNIWYIQEKIDGSQFSFSAHADEAGERRMTFTCGNSERTRDAVMFKKAIDVLMLSRDVFALDWVYHAEMLTSKRQNIVDYDRMPPRFVVIYDITPVEGYLGIEDIASEAQRIGLEHVPALYHNTIAQALGPGGEVNPHEKCLELVQAIDRGEIKSMFGGKPEGVVLKCPGFVDPRGKLVNVKTKYVTPQFEEVRHLKKPAKTKQSIDEFLIWVGAHFDLPARFAKGRQHLAVRDILDGPEYLVLLRAELDLDLIKEQDGLIRSFIENEWPAWRNVRNELWYRDDPLYAEIMASEFDQVYERLRARVLVAARARL